MEQPVGTNPPSDTTALSPDLICSTWEPSDVRLSRDGTRVAWAADPHGRTGKFGESALWTAAVDGSLPARRLTRGGNDTHPRWSPDGSRLAFLSDRSEPGTAGLYLIDPAGGEAEQLVVRKLAVETFAWSPDSCSLALLVPADPDDEMQRREEDRDDAEVYGEKPPRNELVTISVTGAAQIVISLAGLHPTVVDWSPDGSRIAVIARPTPELDVSTGSGVYVVPVDTDGAGAPEVSLVGSAPWADDVCWTSDGADLLVLRRHGDSLQSAVTVWAMPASERSGGAVLGPRIDETVCALGVRAAGSGAPQPAAVSIADGIETRLEWRGGAGAPEVLWHSDGEILDFDVTMTQSGPVVAASVYAGSGPLEVWAGSPDGLRQLSDHHAGWSGIAFGAVEELRTQTADGLELRSVVVMPAGTTSGPYPTVVLPHGGPYWRMARNVHCSWHDWSQLLAAAGYAVILPNFRGGSGHGNAFSTAVLGNPGIEFDDVEAVIESAVQAGIADADRLGIGGWSNGGFLTAWAITHTDRFRAAVMGAGVSSWPTMSMTSDVPTFAGDIAGGSPWTAEPGNSLEHSPLTYAARISTPLLMLHGAQDVRVPLSQSIGMHRALRGRDLPVELVVYPRESHSIEERAHQVDLMSRVVAWFETYLPV